MDVPVFFFTWASVNQILNTSGKNPDGTFWDGGVKGFIRGIPIWNPVNQVFRVHPEKSCQDFPIFHICIRGVSEVYQRCIKGVSAERRGRTKVLIKSPAGKSGGITTVRADTYQDYNHKNS